MKLCCETIMKENEKLKLLDLNECYNNIYEYLQINHKINHYEILLKKEDEEKCLFQEITNKDIKYIDKLHFKQNVDSEIIFKFYGKTKDEIIHIQNELGKIKTLLLIFSQSLFSKYMENELKKLILIDHLTQTYNRHYLDNYIHTILSIANREQKKISFLKLSIDKFKAIVDEFDYSIGDKVIVSLSNVLKHSIRESDLIIKISNDEFLVILQNIINEDNTKIVAQKIIDNFAKCETIVNEKTKQTLLKTICIGIAIYPDDATSIDEIIKKSDIALYEAKNIGRGQIFRFTEESTHTIDLF